MILHVMRSLFGSGRCETRGEPEEPACNGLYTTRGMTHGDIGVSVPMEGEILEAVFQIAIRHLDAHHPAPRPVISNTLRAAQTPINRWPMGNSRRDLHPGVRSLLEAHSAINTLYCRSCLALRRQVERVRDLTIKLVYEIEQGKNQIAENKVVESESAAV